ncbi:MAG: polysaccharide biosynthesis C-terminal domain-containing protein, partial [Caldilineaceae bacterium]
GDAATGYYNAAYNLVFSTVVISNVLNTSLFPSLTRRAAANDGSLQRIYERAFRYLLMISIPIAVGGSLLAHEIIPLLFSDDYLPAIPALRIVIWVVPLMFTSEFLGYVVIINGQEKRAARSVFISTSVNVMLNLIVVPMYGFIGAAVMTCVTEMVLVGQYVWILRESFRDLNWGQLLGRPIAAAALMGICVMVFIHLPVLATVALGMAAYGLSLLLVGGIGAEELRFVGQLRRLVDSRRERMKINQDNV